MPGLHHLDLAGRRIDAALDAVVRQADRARPRLPGQRAVRDAAVLGHAVDLEESQAEPRYQRSSSGGIGAAPPAADAHWSRPSAVRTFLRTMRRTIGMREQPVELRRRHLREHALLELDPQARHREEDRRPRALQVGREGVEGLGEVDVQPLASSPCSTSVRSATCASGR